MPDTADAYQALLCDEVMCVVEEAGVKLGPSFRLTGDAQKEACTLVNGSNLADAQQGQLCLLGPERALRAQPRPTPSSTPLAAGLIPGIGQQVVT